MKLQLFDFVCARCAHAFRAPELPANAYGEFLLRSAGAREVRYLNALQDASFAEVDELLQADAQAGALPPTRRLALLREIYGTVACDPDAAGAPLRLGAHGACPACGSLRMRSWEASSPAQWVEPEVPAVSHACWSCLSATQKSERVREAVARLLAVA